MKKYKVLSRIDADRRYEAGETIELSDADAAPLFDVRWPCIELLDSKQSENPGGGSQEVKLEDLTIPKLRDLAAELKLNIPVEVTKKADIVQLIADFKAKQSENPGGGSQE